MKSHGINWCICCEIPFLSSAGYCACCLDSRDLKWVTMNIRIYKPGPLVIYNKIIWHISYNFYPRPALAFGYCHRLHLCMCVCPCVCVCQSVCQSLACPRDNSGPVQAGITKFGPKMQKTLVKVPIVLGGGGGGQLTMVKVNLKVRICPILSLYTP